MVEMANVHSFVPLLKSMLDAFIATIVKQLNKNRPLNSFQRGIRNVVYLMIAFMLVMVPIVSTLAEGKQILDLTSLGAGYKRQGHWQLESVCTF